MGCTDGVLRILDRKLRVRQEILLRSPPLAPAEVQKQFPGRVLVDRFSADLEPGIVTWFRSEADSF
ncbi:MAG: hypothetical protein COZ06_34465, partial [Armatimonadetes bacterium CG_4_10_14_3_um_filter_66_18]